MFSAIHFKSHLYFIKLFEVMELPINYHVIPAGVEAFGADNWDDQLNSPFIIDINILSNYFNMR
jgi:hypothetical protein